MSKETEDLRRKLEDLEPRLQELSLKSAQSEAKALELITGMERRLEERVVGHVQGLAQGRVAALEEALMDSDEKAFHDMSSLNVTLGELGQSFAALESKVKKSFAALESKTKQLSATLDTKLELPKCLHSSPWEAAGSLHEAGGSCSLNSMQPHDAGPREGACSTYKELLERFQSLEAELQHHCLESMKLVEQRILPLETELGQQKKGYNMLSSQLNGWLDMQQKARTKIEHAGAPQNPQAPPTTDAGRYSKDQPRLYSRSQCQRPNRVLHHEPQLRVSTNVERPTSVAPTGRQQWLSHETELLDVLPNSDGPPKQYPTPRSMSPFSRYSCMFE